MDTQDIINYYADLLIIQYRGKPNARAEIAALVTPIIMDQLPTTLQNAFQVDTAIGAQLDILGKYIGISRNGYSDGLPVTLDDDDYRKLLRIVLIKNFSGSSLKDIADLLETHFPNEIIVSDSLDMTLLYTIVSSAGSSDLLGMLSSGDYLPRPMGVETSVVIVSSHTYPLFGFRTYGAAPGGRGLLNTYSLYQTTNQFLTY